MTKMVPEPPFSDKRGFLAEMRPVTGDYGKESGSAETPFVIKPVDTAPAGADRAGQ